ncbi:MAG: DUF1360 domain-containing protein [Gemmatimonadaceae bacterium]
MIPRWFELTIAVLATWRVSHLIAREDGPWDVILRVRGMAGTSMIGRLMDCPYCLSLWVAAPVVFLVDERWTWRVVLWLAVSGGSCLLERLWESHAPGTRDATTDGRED